MIDLWLQIVLLKSRNIPDVSEEERSPLVAELIDICCLQQELILSQQEQIQILRDEIAILKNQQDAYTQEFSFHAFSFPRLKDLGDGSGEHRRMSPKFHPVE